MIKHLPINLQLNAVDMLTEQWLYGSDIIDNFHYELKQTAQEIKRKGKKRIYGVSAL